MKKNISRYAIIFISLGSLLLSSSTLCVDRKKLNHYFAQFTDSVNCFMQRKPCTQQEKDNAYKIGRRIIYALGIAITGYTLYSFFTYNPLDAEMRKIGLDPHSKAGQFVKGMHKEWPKAMQEKQEKEELLKKRLENLETESSNPDSYLYIKDDN